MKLSISSCIVAMLSAGIAHAELSYITNERLTAMAQETATAAKDRLDSLALKSLKDEAKEEAAALQWTLDALHATKGDIQKIASKCRYNDTDRAYCFALNDLSTFALGRIAKLKETKETYGKSIKALLKNAKKDPQAVQDMITWARANRLFDADFRDKDFIASGYVNGIRNILELDRDQVPSEVAAFTRARAALVSFIDSEQFKSLKLGAEVSGANLYFTAPGQWGIFVIGRSRSLSLPKEYAGLPVISVLKQGIVDRR